MMTAKEVLTKPDAVKEVLTKSDKAVLLKFLEIEWQDHFQTRTQTWKTLEIEAPLVIGLIGIDWQLRNRLATMIVAALLIIAAYFGARITIHHREVEQNKISTIIDIENALGAAEMGLFTKVHRPSPLRWYSVFSRQSSTSLFILIMHYILMLFGATYLIFTLVSRDNVGRRVQFSVL